jgi:hypothetical protein
MLTESPVPFPNYGLVAPGDSRHARKRSCPSARKFAERWAGASRPALSGGSQGSRAVGTRAAPRVVSRADGGLANSGGR